jgi:hypothetical protein
MRQSDGPLQELFETPALERGGTRNMQSNVVVFAKRSLGLSKTQAVIGLILAAIGLFTIVSLTLFASTSSAQYFLLSVSPLAFGIVMVPMPVILLYVYDKNNGVLEHLLSIGWNQNDIFKQYLRAALFLALTVFVAESVVVLIACAIAGSLAIFLLDVLMLLLTAFLGLSTVSFTVMAMMAFSSLQKQRTGGNAPLAMGLGAAFILPTFYLVFLGFTLEFLIVLSIAGLAGGLSLTLLVLSSRLIRREKMLP